MKKTLYAIICYLSIALVSSAFSGAAFAEGHGAFGLWLTDKGRSRVEIKNCEPENPQSPLCGYIIWLEQPFKANGEPLRDRRNERPELRDRPILGLPILWGLRLYTSGALVGQVYNPEDGKAYYVEVSLLKANKLKVEGCLGKKMLGGINCEQRYWTRVEATQADNQTGQD